MSSTVEDGGFFGKSAASRSLWIRSELIMGDPFGVRKPLSLSILGYLSEICYRHIWSLCGC